MNTSVMTSPEQARLSDSEQGGVTISTAVHVRPDAAHELTIGQCVHGKYTVHGVLGHGGFAVVYDVEHLGLGRRVALKVLHLRDDTPVALVERFRREARISALARHPNVLEVYDTGSLPDGSPYLVMERVNGQNLSAHIARGPLSIAMAVEVARQLLQGLSALADAGIVHRDIKPDNLMIHQPDDGPPLIKLVDFGISKRVSLEPETRLTCHGTLVGTPQYMAPEQIRGEEVDAGTDLYAAGAVLYETLTGHAPHESSNFSELVVAVLNSQVRPVRALRPNCPVELEQAILKALARDRDARPASARELLDALDEVACAYDLPRGADAFRAADGPELIATCRARSSLAFAVRWWPPLFGQPRPLQLAMVALLVGAQGAVTQVNGPAESTSLAEAEPAAASAADVSSGAVASSSLIPTSAPSALEPGTLAPGSLLDPASVSDGEGSAPPATEPAQAEAASRDESAPASSPATPLNRGTRAAGAASREIAPQGRAPEAAAEPSPVRSGQRELSAQSAAGRPLAVARHPESAPVGIDRAAGWEQAMSEGLAAMVNGKLNVARQRYGEAVRLSPRAAAGFRGLGLVAARLGQHKEARAALEHYLELAPQASDREAILARIAALPR